MSATRRAFAALAFALLGIAASAPSAAALVIRGDALWRGMEPCPSDWADPALDDSAWLPVLYPWIFTWPRDAPDLPAGHTFWADTERGESCVRRHFTVPGPPTSPAQLRIWVDDDYVLYINGSLVAVNDDHGGGLPGETYDVTPFIHSGDNVIALKLIDYGGDDRAALVELTIPDAPDEPLRFANVMALGGPWMTVVGLLAVGVIVLLAVRAFTRRVSPWVADLPPGTAAFALVGVLLLCQWLLQRGLFYSVAAHPANPWAAWEWGHIILFGLALACLVVVATPNGERRTTLAPPRYEWLIVAAIVGLATLLRTVALDSIPVGFHQDEAINGNDALALYDGRPFELWSDSIGGRPTFFLYLLGAALRTFGRSYLALKIVPVAFGVASVLVLYALGRSAFGPRPALWAAFFLAVSWWHIRFSRIAWEVICVPFFSAAGFALLLHGLRERCRHPTPYLIGASALLTAGLYTYAAYRAVPVAVVVFLLATLFSQDRAVLRQRVGALLAAAVVAVIVAAPLAHFAWSHPQMYFRRFADVSLTKYMTYHATPVPWLHQIGKALLAFNQRGDENNPLVGPFLESITGALFLLGMVIRASPEQRRGKRLLWAWFVSFLALASLTKDSPHLTRMLGMVAPIALFAGLGATGLIARLRAAGATRAAVVAAIVMAVGATTLNAYQYFIDQPNLPDTDLKMNLKARRLCETFRRKAPVRFLWTNDLDYWCAAQCRFLVPGTVSRAEIVNASDLANGAALRSIPRPLLLAVGGEFVDLQKDSLPHDANGEPRLDLPVRPRLYLDREARRMYYLYDLLK